LAETFKYFYLLFADEKALDFKSVVFNTEAHPIRRSWQAFSPQRRGVAEKK
jgi:mannosidase alpha-like ER degradation enhancer 2